MTPFSKWAKDWNRYFARQGTQAANIHTWRCSVSPDDWEAQSKPQCGPPTRPGTTGIGTPGPRAAEGLGAPEARLLGLTCLPSTRLSAPTGRRAPRTRTAAPGCPARLPAAGRGCCSGLFGRIELCLSWVCVGILILGKFNTLLIVLSSEKIVNI